MKKDKTKLNLNRRNFLTGTATLAGIAATASVVPITIANANHSEGKKGLPRIAKLSFNNAQYAAGLINKCNNFNILYNRREFIKEFVLTTKLSARKVQNDAIKNNILINIPEKDKSDNKILVAFTEKRTKDEIDKLITFLKSYD